MSTKQCTRLEVHAVLPSAIGASAVLGCGSGRGLSANEFLSTDGSLLAALTSGSARGGGPPLIPAVRGSLCGLGIGRALPVFGG